MRKPVQILAAAVGLVMLTLGTVAGGSAQQPTITMRDFSFTPDKITLQAGVPTEITIVNKGKVKHEFLLYPKPKPGMSVAKMHEWAEDNSYFKGLQVLVEGPGIQVERKGTTLHEVGVGVGKTAIVKFTPSKKGTFEFACLTEGHYEAGQRGTLVVR